MARLSDSQRAAMQKMIRDQEEPVSFDTAYNLICSEVGALDKGVVRRLLRSDVDALAKVADLSPAKKKTRKPSTPESLEDRVVNLEEYVANIETQIREFREAHGIQIKHLANVVQGLVPRRIAGEEQKAESRRNGQPDHPIKRGGTQNVLFARS